MVLPRMREVGKRGRKEGTHRLSGVFHLPDAEVLQRDDPPGLLVLNRKVASVPGTTSLQACY